ncbi:hypothetical protein [Spirosoma litoris]
MSTHLAHFRRFIGACLLIFLGLLSACGPSTKTKTATVPVDTTVFDDDTLEVGNAAKLKKTERAVETEHAR